MAMSDTSTLEAHMKDVSWNVVHWCCAMMGRFIGMNLISSSWKGHGELSPNGPK